MDFTRVSTYLDSLEEKYQIHGLDCLIMKDHETVVFIEVKTRLHAVPGSGLMAVDRKKQQRIARAAILYLISKGWMNLSVRFDVAEVTEKRVLHIPNAFQPGNMFYR